MTHARTSASGRIWAAHEPSKRRIWIRSTMKYISAGSRSHKVGGATFFQSSRSHRRRPRTSACKSVVEARLPALVATDLGSPRATKSRHKTRVRITVRRAQLERKRRFDARARSDWRPPSVCAHIDEWISGHVEHAFRLGVCRRPRPQPGRTSDPNKSNRNDDTNLFAIFVSPHFKLLRCLERKSPVLQISQKSS